MLAGVHHDGSTGGPTQPCQCHSIRLGLNAIPNEMAASTEAEERLTEDIPVSKTDIQESLIYHVLLYNSVIAFQLPTIRTIHIFPYPYFCFSDVGFFDVTIFSTT